MKASASVMEIRAPKQKSLKGFDRCERALCAPEELS
jgi:hypothetical protein